MKRFDTLLPAVVCMLLPLLGLTQELSFSRDLNGILIREAGQKVLFYQEKTKSLGGAYPRAHYFHPVYGLDGAVLTEDFPEDHPHHRGIFWAWHQVYIGNKGVGDAWECRDFEWDVREVSVSPSGDGKLVMDIITHWKSPLWKDNEGIQHPFLEERTRVTIHPRQTNLRVIEFESTYIPLENGIRLGGSKDEKGYGGFSVRMKLPADIRFTSGEDAVLPEEGPVTAGRWMDISGSLALDGGPAGITLLSYPPAAGDTEQWILRSRGSMQNIPFPGPGTIALSKEAPLQLNYALIIHSGPLPRDKINGIYAGLNKQAPRN